MARSLDAKRIKSAQRALEVLEYFQCGRAEATVMDIARSMGYPQSSTSELLSCLVSLGYLMHDRSARTYRPSARVAVLGARVHPNLFREGRLLPIMDELASETQCTIVLGSRVGLDVQYIHAVTPEGVGAAEIAEGSSAPIAHSGIGRALMAVMDRNYARKLMHRYNAETAPEMRVPFDELTQGCDMVHTNGYSCADHAEGYRMIAVLLPHGSAEEDLGLGVIIPNAQFEEKLEHYVQMLRGAAARLSAQPRPVRPSYAQPAAVGDDMRMTA